MRTVLPWFARKSNKSYYFQANHKQTIVTQNIMKENRLANVIFTHRKIAPQKRNEMKQTKPNQTQNKMTKCDFIENICLLWRCQLVHSQININVMLFAVIRCPFLSLLITWTEQSWSSNCSSGFKAPSDMKNSYAFEHSYEFRNKERPTRRRQSILFDSSQR